MKDMMKLRMKNGMTLIGLVLVGCSLLESTYAVTGTANKTTARKQDYGVLPLAFEANNGQSSSEVQFISRGQGYSLFVTRNAEVVLTLRKSGQAETTKPISKLKAENPRTSTTEVLRVRLVGAQDPASADALDALPGVTNYFVGRDPSQWRTNVPLFRKVKMRDVYPGVDMAYYGNGRQLEEDFIVAPGADPRMIEFVADGARKVSIDTTGELVMTMKTGDVRFHKPLAYQEDNGVRHEVASRYVLGKHSHVRLELASFDRKRTLVIDPTLTYSTYLGGSDNDNGGAIALDSSGNAYLTGDTASADFPTTAAAFQTTSGTNTDVYVTKLNATGTAVVYSTYLGGSGLDSARAIAVDPSGNAYITGVTESANFPTTSGVFQPALAGTKDAFVTKLNSTGSALVYSSYLGGAANQDVFNSPLQLGTGIAVDVQGNAYVAGETDATDFPVTAGAFQTTYGSVFSGDANAFVTKVNPTGSGLVYSTYVGGSAAQAFGIAIDSSGNAYITGLAMGGYPTTTGAYQTTFGGGYSDAFVTKLNSTGTGLVYSTYIGGSSGEQADAIAIDSAGNAYVAGIAGTGYPTTAGAFQTAVSGFTDAFVTKLNASGSALVYSTYLGGNTDAYAYGIAVDATGNAYVVGSTNSTVFPMTANALQPTYGGGAGDAFITVFNPAGSSLVYSSYLGGSGGLGDSAGGVAVDSSLGIYVSGNTASADFPTTAGAFQTTLHGTSDAFVAKIGGAVGCTPRQFVLDASLSYATGRVNAYITPQPPLEFALPAKIPVISGNAGTGITAFAFGLGSQTGVACAYVGANAGTEYDLSVCTQSGLTAGSLVTADKILLTVLTAKPPTIFTHFPPPGGAKVEVTLNDATCP